ncbi:hypothetical protein [Kistimonas scapharcae]|uniref:hypothetical protein n=1 Tax=Kistimonas scapharcae TaxID=1036133 RepID=UPI0031EEF073
MQAITSQDINTIAAASRILPETEGTALLDRFQDRQPQFYEAIFGELSDAIAEDSFDMANLFLDLCFDIIFLYHRTQGEIPKQPEDERWLEVKMALLDAELKSLVPGNAMNGNLTASLNDRFVDRCRAAGTPLALLAHLDEQVCQYASFDPSRPRAIPLVNNLLFVVVRLMDDIYDSRT